jgi:hypothetical protein
MASRSLGKGGANIAASYAAASTSENGGRKARLDADSSQDDVGLGSDTLRRHSSPATRLPSYERASWYGDSDASFRPTQALADQQRLSIQPAAAAHGPQHSSLLASSVMLRSGAWAEVSMSSTFEVFRRDVAARVIQAHWQRYRSWKAQVRCPHLGVVHPSFSARLPSLSGCSLVSNTAAALFNFAAAQGGRGAHPEPGTDVRRRPGLGPRAAAQRHNGADQRSSRSATRKR